MEDDLWDQLINDANNKLGIEKLEEMNESAKVIEELFGEGANYSSLMSMFGILSGKDTMVLFVSQYLTGCAMYRELMINNGIDVNAIEKKALEEKRNGDGK